MQTSEQYGKGNLLTPAQWAEDNNVPEEEVLCEFETDEDGTVIRAGYRRMDFWERLEALTDYEPKHEGVWVSGTLLGWSSRPDENPPVPDWEGAM